jgi:hypothetical protein
MQTWLPIPGFSRYEIDEYGDVRNRTTMRAHKCYFSKKGPGYRKLRIFLIADDGRQKSRAVARHVLSTFVRLPLPGEQARHLDDDVCNNYYSNLAWGTAKQNADDAKRNGGGTVPMRKITPEQARAIRAAPRRTVAALARSLGVHKEAAHKIARGQRYVDPAP